jgi:hypothetical protein
MRNRSRPSTEELLTKALGLRGTLYQDGYKQYRIDWDDGTVYCYKNNKIVYARSNRQSNGLESSYDNDKLVRQEIYATRARAATDMKTKGWAYYDDAGKIARIEYILYGETEYFEDGKHVRSRLRNGDIDYFEDGKLVRSVDSESGQVHHYVNNEISMIENADGEINYYDPGVQDKYKCLMRVKTEFKQKHKYHGRVYFYENNRINKIEMKKGYLDITGSRKWASFLSK